MGFVPGQFTQAIADAGDSGAIHSAIAIATTQPTFFEHVQIATSDDRRTWTVVVRSALIYRVEFTDRGSSQVNYGPSRARWVRIRILNGSRPFPMDGATFPAEVVPPQLVTLTNTQSTRQSGSNTIVTFDFGTPNTNVGAVAFEASTLQYARGVLFERPANGESDWEHISNAQISTYRSQRRAETATAAISTGDQHVRALRVTIHNGNDIPLAGLRVTPLGYSHHIVFQATPGAQYRLIWSNADAIAPIYDLGDVLQHEPWTVAAVATLGGAASTAFAASASAGTPWLQQAALPIALALLFVVLLVVALIAMRAKPASDRSELQNEFAAVLEPEAAVERLGIFRAGQSNRSAALAARPRDGAFGQPPCDAAAAVGRLHEDAGNRREAIAQHLIRPPVVDENRGAADDVDAVLGHVQHHRAAPQLPGEVRDQAIVPVVHEPLPVEAAFPDHPRVHIGEGRKQGDQIFDVSGRAARFHFQRFGGRVRPHLGPRASTAPT